MNIRSLCSLFPLLIFSLVGAACSSGLPLPNHTAAPTAGVPTAPATFTPQPTPTVSPTPLIPVALLLAPEGADRGQIEAAGQALSNLSAQEGLRWQMRTALSAADLTPDVRLVLALPPASGLEELAKGAPQVQFLAVGIPGLQSLPNLSQIGAEASSPERAAFLAGIIAAILTDDWRVGVISLSDTPEGVAARQGFLNGVVFFCGLCRQIYPPYYQYPLYIEYPSGASPAERLSAVTALTDRFVKTAYLYPGAADPALLKALDEAGILVIGGASPGAARPTHWAATVQSDPSDSIQAILPDLLAGKGGAVLPLALEITDVNPELFSPGRLALAEKYLAEILAGVIEPGAPPDS
jgi:hypothetical protein